MRRSISHLFLTFATASALYATFGNVATAQLQQQTTTFAIRFDPVQLLAERPLNVLPMWLQSVSVQHYRFDSADLNLSKADAKQLQHTCIRLHLRRLNFLAPKVELRLSLLPGQGQATVSSWTETGTKTFQTEPFGSETQLLSESVCASIEGADYLEIDLPGDGSRLSNLFASAMRYAKVLQAVDFNPPPIADAFGSAANTQPPRSQDRYLWNRVDAPLEIDSFTLESAHPELVEFELASQPECAVITFEARNVAAEFPPLLQLNDTELPAASLTLPDLADPAWRSPAAPRTAAESIVHYSGWIRVQQFLPGAALQKGKNVLQLAHTIEDESTEIRRLELQIRARR